MPCSQPIKLYHSAVSNAQNNNLTVLMQLRTKWDISTFQVENKVCISSEQQIQETENSTIYNSFILSTLELIGTYNSYPNMCPILIDLIGNIRAVMVEEWNPNRMEVYSSSSHLFLHHIDDK